MSTQKIPSFDNSLQKTQAWIQELDAKLQWGDLHKSYKALRVTLHTLRDRLPLSEVVQLGAQLPMLVRGFYYDGWRPLRTPQVKLNKKEFLSAIEDEFRDEVGLDAEKVCKAVFYTIEMRVSPGECGDIASVLPRDLRELWIAA